MFNGLIFNMGRERVKPKPIPRLFEPLRTGEGIDDRHLLKECVVDLSKSKDYTVTYGCTTIKGVKSVHFETSKSLVGKIMKVEDMPVGTMFDCFGAVIKVSECKYIGIADPHSPTDMTRFVEGSSMVVISDPVIEIGDKVKCLDSGHVFIYDNPRIYTGNLTIVEKGPLK